MINLTKYLAGRGQQAKELPERWQCYDLVEVEGIINEILLDIELGKLKIPIQKD